MYLLQIVIQLKHYVVFVTESNSARLIGMGGVPQLLGLHSEWQQMDTKHRCLSIRKAILLILKNITNLSE